MFKTEEPDVIGIEIALGDAEKKRESFDTAQAALELSVQEDQMLQVGNDASRIHIAFLNAHTQAKRIIKSAAQASVPASSNNSDKLNVR